MEILPEVFKKVHCRGQFCSEILKKVEKSGAQLVAVTKYFDAETTRTIFQKIKNVPGFLALGENRAEVLAEKNLPCASTHFIGKIQSRKIPEISKFCSAVHSLDSISHAKKFAAQPQVPAFFLQINISREPQKLGISPENLENFLAEIADLGLKILGISAIGAGEFDLEKKRAEFLELVRLRDKFLPGKKISAGTSRDFEIALASGIEIVRVGQALFPQI